MRFKERRRGQTGAAGHALGQNLETPHRGGGERLAHAPAGLLQIGKTDSDNSAINIRSDTLLQPPFGNLRRISCG